MSGIKGYPSQKKSLSRITGYTAEQTETRDHFATVQKSISNKIHQDVINSGLFRVGSVDLTEALSTKRLIKATAHGASVGDVIRFETGANIHVEMGVLSVPDANTIVLAGELETDPTIGDNFYVMRYVTPRYNDDGDLQVTATLSQAPIQYVYNGVDTEVEEVTATQANSRPLPIKVLNTLVPSVYNEITLTYVAAGNGIGEIQTVVFEQAGSTVATLTLSYDSSNRLSNVVRS